MAEISIDKLSENEYDYRAWAIFKWKDENWIVTEFNHDKGTVRLAKWLHKIDPAWIRAIMPLKVEIEMDRIKFENEATKLLFVW